MSTTARTLIQRSLTLLRVLNAEVPDMTARQAEDGLASLNDLLASFKDLDHKPIGLDDQVPLPDEHIRPLRYVLAVDLAGEYGNKLTPEVAAIAAESERVLKAAYLRVGTLTVDRALLNDRTGTYNVETDQ